MCVGFIQMKWAAARGLGGYKAKSFRQTYLHILTKWFRVLHFAAKNVDPDQYNIQIWQVNYTDADSGLIHLK